MNSRHILEYSAVAFVVFVLIFLPQTGYSKDQPGINHYIDGTEDYDAGMYESALSSLGKAIDLEPSNLDYQYYFAMTYSALGRYQEAESIYAAILNQDAKNYYKAYFDIAEIYMKKKDYKKALEIISTAEWVVPDNANLYLKKGVLNRKLKKYKNAIDNFNMALEIDKTLSQIVNYNLGLVYYHLKQNTNAKKMFEMVISEKPDNQLSDYAKMALEGVAATVKAQKPWKVTACLSYAYDDNLSENPLDLPGHMSSLADDRDGQYQVFFIMGEYKMMELKNFWFSGGYQMTYINFNDSEHENSFENSPYFLANYNLKPVSLSLKYNFAHYFADSDERQIQHKINPVIIITEPHDMKSVFSFVYQIKDYKSDSPVEDVNVWTAELTQYIAFPEIGITPRIRLKYGDEDSDAAADTYSYFESSIGIEAELPFGLTGDLSVSDIRTGYKENYGIKRKDTGYLIETSLRKDINKTLGAGLCYSYTHNKSNVTNTVYGFDPYKYDENNICLFFSMNY